MRYCHRSVYRFPRRLRSRHIHLDAEGRNEDSADHDLVAPEEHAALRSVWVAVG